MARQPRTPPNFDDLLSRRHGEFTEAFRQPHYQDLVRRCQLAYRHWHKVRIIAEDASRRGTEVDPEILWLLIKFTRLSQLQTLPLQGDGGVGIQYAVPDRVQHELMRIDRDLGGSLTAPDEQPLDATQRERFIVNAFREEAIASSMLEGASTTRRVAKDMLRSGRNPRTRGEKMVLNNYQAIQFIREHRNAELSPDLLLELQEILTAETLDDPKQSGRFRHDDDEIVVMDDRDGTVVHTPPPAQELGPRLESLCEFANAATDYPNFIHPVIRACAIHFQIGFDHPFCDGNGRTARAIFYWHMLKNGYWLFEYLPISRLIYAGPANYMRAFLYTETDAFDLTYFLVYKARLLRRARAELHDYLGRKRREVISARRLFSNDRNLNHRQRHVLLRALRNPDRVFTIAEHQIEHHVAYGTANTDLAKLVDLQYLARVRIGNRYEFLRGPKLDELQSHEDTY